MNTETNTSIIESEPKSISKSEADYMAEEEYNPTGVAYVFLMYAGIGVISTAIGVGFLLLIYTVAEITLCLITGQHIK